MCLRSTPGWCCVLAFWAPIRMMTRIGWSDVIRLPSRQILIVAGAFALGAVQLAAMRPAAQGSTMRVWRGFKKPSRGITPSYARSDALFPSRLAFNSSFFPVPAMFGQGPLAGEA